MSNSILLLINTLIPLLIFIAVGFVIGYFCKFDKKKTDALTDITFYILMPCSIFLSCAGSTLEKEHLKLFLFCACYCVLFTKLCGAFCRKIVPDLRKATSFAVASWKSNLTIIGLPLAASILSERGYSIYTILLIIMVPLSNIVLALTVSKVTDSNYKFSVKSTLKTIITNPIIDSTLLGFIFSVFSIPIPSLLRTTISSLGGATTPVSLLLIGISISQHRDFKNIKLDLIASCIKLIICPVGAVLLALLLGIRGSSIGAIALLFGVPTALNCGIVVDGMHGDGATAHEITFFSTLCSMATLFCGGILLSINGWL